MEAAVDQNNIQLANLAEPDMLGAKDLVNVAVKHQHQVQLALEAEQKAKSDLENQLKEATTRVRDLQTKLDEANQAYAKALNQLNVKSGLSLPSASASSQGQENPATPTFEVNVDLAAKLAKDGPLGLVPEADSKYEKYQASMRESGKGEQALAKDVWLWTEIQQLVLAQVYIPEPLRKKAKPSDAGVQAPVA